jgi:hypothetical protein
VLVPLLRTWMEQPLQVMAKNEENWPVPWSSFELWHEVPPNSNQVQFSFFCVLFVWN